MMTAYLTKKKQKNSEARSETARLGGILETLLRAPQARPLHSRAAGHMHTTASYRGTGGTQDNTRHHRRWLQLISHPYSGVKDQAIHAGFSPAQVQKKNVSPKNIKPIQLRTAYGLRHPPLARRPSPPQPAKKKSNYHIRSL